MSASDNAVDAAKEKAREWNVCDPESCIKPDAVRQIADAVHSVIMAEMFDPEPRVIDKAGMAMLRRYLMIPDPDDDGLTLAGAEILLKEIGDPSLGLDCYVRVGDITDHLELMRDNGPAKDNPVRREHIDATVFAIRRRFATKREDDNADVST